MTQPRIPCPEAKEGSERYWAGGFFRSSLFQNAAAVGFVVLATLTHLWVNHQFGIWALFVFSYLGVLVSAYIGGWRTGCLTGALSLLVAGCLYQLDKGVSPSGLSYPVRFAIFLAVSGVTIGLAEMQRQARRRAEKVISELKREIIQHEQTESKLALSEERYRSLFENSLDAVFTLNTQGNFTTANPSALRLCGYSMAELREMKFTELCLPDQREEVSRQFQLSVQGNPEPCFEARLVTKEGRRLDLLITSGRFKLKGETAGVFGIAADITERKKSQAHLAAFSRLGQQLSSVTTPVAAGQIIGDVTEEMFGWDAFSLNLYSPETNRADSVLNVDTLAGKKIEILPFQSGPGIPALAHRIMAHGPELVLDAEGVSCELMVFCGGRGRFASVMYVPIHDKDKTIGVLAVRSRQPDAYDENDLKTLLALGDYCGGALQRIRAEETSHRNEQEYRALFDSDGSGKSEVTPQTGQFLRANPKFCELIGYSESELKEKTFLDITVPEDWKVSEQNFQRLVRGEIDEYRLEKRYLRKDQSVCWMDTTVTLVRDAQGQPTRAIASSIDITARVKAEAALRESENRFTSFMQHLSASAWMKDVQGRYLYVNAVGAKLLGKPPEDIVGRTDAELVTPDMARCFDSTDQGVLSTGGALQTLETYQGEDGMHYSAVSKFPIRDKQGEIAIVAGIAVDITDRKAAEQALAISNQRLSLIAQVTNAVVGDAPLALQMHHVAETVRVAYGVKACIIRVLDGEELSLLAAAGVDPGKLAPRTPINCRIGMDVMNQRSPLFIPDLRHIEPDAANSPQPVNTHNFVSYAGAPLIAQDKVIGMMGIYTEQRIRDFTRVDLQHLQVVANHIAVAIANDRLYRQVSRQKTALEEQIRERQQAEAEVQNLNGKLESRVMERTRQLQMANAELEAFAYSVSHDLRGPLRSVGGFSEALKDEYEERLDEQGREYINRVLHSCREMDKLIDDMLHLSRLTRMDMQRQSVNLSQLAEGVVAQLQEAEPRRPVQVTIAPNLVAAADARLIRIALENLLNNAWKFTGRTREAEVEFGALPQPEGTAFFVRDNGAGFDMTFAGKLFGAFQRLHSTHEFPGHGIGLATVQRIIHRHGGKTWAVGEVDRGAAFYFTLPS